MSAVGTGKVLGIDLGSFPPRPNLNAVYVTFERCNGDKEYRSLRSFTTGVSYDACQTSADNDPGGAIDAIASTYVITNIDTTDGSPDDCGNADGTVQEERCVFYQFQGELAPTKFCLDENASINGEVCFISQGVKVCVGPDGITIEQDALADEEDVKDIDELPFDEENFDEEDSECTPPEDIELEADGGIPEGVEACEGETEELKWLLVKVTKEPYTGKVILYPDPQNDCIFAGYVAWYIEKGGEKLFLPAFPIRKRNNAFKPPADVNGYNVYSTNGAKLSIKELKEKKSDG